MVMNPNIENTSSAKRRKLKSKVWEDFTKYEKNGKEWAKCNHCKKDFVGSSKSGTTHLKNHLKSCPSLKNSGGVADKAKEKSVIDPELNVSDLTRKIFKYGLKGIKNDILDVYQQEKDKLRGYLHKLPCRFNVTIQREAIKVDMEYMDMWSMKIWFIDDSWELKDRIICLEENKCDVVESVKSSLVDWNLDKKICSMIRTKYIFEEKKDEDICKWFNERGSLSFTAICLSVHSLLQRIYFDISFYALEKISRNDILYKLNKLMDYVRTNENKFRSAIEKAVSKGKTITSKSVVLPVWHEDVLEWIMGYKEAFCELEHIDPDFMSINLIKEDWDDATLLYNSWKVLKDWREDVGKLLEPKQKTANVYFPVICQIFSKLIQFEKSDNHYFYLTVSRVREDFDEYCYPSKLVLVITLILDPRFKLDFIIENFYKEMYGNDEAVHLNGIIDDVTNIFNQYAKGTNNSMSSSFQESEFNCYLRNPKCPSDEGFDILEWWRLNYSTYPILARMARDFLSIPIFHIDEDNSLPEEIDEAYDCL